jgi:hypothetical protein
MKIAQTTFNDKIFGAEKEMTFSIDDDNSIIFDILRDKMYSNKIGSICREVSSNARDANREAGRGDKSIEIQIVEPNKLLSISDMSIIFRDFGLGISPDRMENVFVKYAASTKRDSNGQTGGFGLGAKTPFAYTDTFTVVTVCNWAEPITEIQDVEVAVFDDKDPLQQVGTEMVSQRVVVGHKPVKRIKYTYSALIDSTRKGKMVLFDSEESTDATGTQIIIPIESADRREFEHECTRATCLWDIKVDYLNFETIIPNQENFEVIINEDTYMIVKDHNSILSSDQYMGLIDGIPYPINKSSLGISDSGCGYDHTIIAKFDVGALTISANREAVQYDEPTIKAMKEVLELVKEDLRKRVMDYVTETDNFLEACYKKNTLFGSASSNMSTASSLDKIYKAVLVNDYSTKGILASSRDLISKTVEYKGMKLIQTIPLHHHTAMTVHKPSDGNKVDYIVLKENKITRTWIDSPIYYMDVRKNVRRNITIWDSVEAANTHTRPSFMLLVPKASSTQQDINEEALKISCEWNIAFKLYSDVKKSESNDVSTYAAYTPGTTANMKVRINDGGYWNSEILEFHREKKVFWNSATDTQDTRKFAYRLVQSLTELKDCYNAYPIIDALSDVKVIAVTEKMLDRYMEDMTDIKTADRLTADLIKNNQKQLTEYKINSMMTETLDEVNAYIKELFPEILPKTVREAMINHKREKRHLPILKEIEVKFDFSGLKKKVKQNLNKYPMLGPYITKVFGIAYGTIDESRMQDHIAAHTKEISHMKRYIEMVN